MHANKGKKFPPEVLTGEEVSRLVKQTSMRAPTGLRNRALIILGYRSGVRISEALALYPKDVDTQTGKISILHGKGDKQRIVGLDPLGCEILQRWIDRRHTLRFTARQPLFCTLTGGKMKTSYVRHLMKRLGRKAGIEKRVHFHGLRHAFASGLANEGAPMLNISGLLGHESMSTTDRYLRRVAPQALIDMIRKREWKL